MLQANNQFMHVQVSNVEMANNWLKYLLYL
jgi:hypothetical protein